MREKGPVSSIYGPHICGESIDFYRDGYTVLTGSYRQDDALQLWDLRTGKCTRTYDWDGPDGMGIAEKENEDSDKKQKFIPKTPPMLYGAMFNKR